MQTRTVYFDEIEDETSAAFTLKISGETYIIPHMDIEEFDEGEQFIVIGEEYAQEQIDQKGAVDDRGEELRESR